MAPTSVSLTSAEEYARAHDSFLTGKQVADLGRAAEQNKHKLEEAYKYVKDDQGGRIGAGQIGRAEEYAVEHGFLDAQQSAALGMAGHKGNVLGPHDVVGTTFFIACNMMLAFTAFFFVQVGVVPKQWRTSVSIAGLVTGVAFYNYTFMKDQWVHLQTSPTNFRYTDWLITVPLQIVEFYFILQGGGLKVPGNLGLRLFSASLLMVGFGWMAEIDVLAKVVGFALGCACWLYIVYETFSGEAASYAAKLQKQASRDAFNYVRLIVAVGWTIYPLGFAIAYIIPGTTIRPFREGPPYNPLNVLYNLADLINKGAFGLAIWSAAVSDVEKADPLLG